MPRQPRSSQGGYCCHVLNRGNARKTVFFKDGDYIAFIKLLQEANEQTPMRLLAWCLMPNHFHPVLRPHHDGDLSNDMAWLMTAHVRRYHQHYHSSGHIWQGRFRDFPIQEDDHLLTVLRYVERNALRANLVKRAEDWRWSSVGPPGDGWPTLAAAPVRRPLDWLAYVNEPQTDKEVERLRECTRRRRPFGAAPWQAETAVRLGLEASLRPRGRPPKDPPKQASLFDEAE